MKQQRPPFRSRLKARVRGRRKRQAADVQIVFSPQHIAPALPPLKTIAVEVYRRLWEDDVFGRAAQLAYYWLFSIFPFLIFMTALLAYINTPNLFDSLFEYLQSVLPVEAYTLLRTTFLQITRRPRGGLLSFGILAAIWGASAGMESLINSLNNAYDVPRGRGWWREKLLSIELTLGLTAFVVIALVLLFFGGTIGNSLASGYGLGKVFQVGWHFARWLAVILFIFVALETLYYIAPNLKQRWRSTTPGAFFALLAWLLISFGFKAYVSRFGNFNATYGALGGLMALMVWLYLTGVAILVGGEINSVIIKAQTAALQMQPKPSVKSPA